MTRGLLYLAMLSVIATAVAATPQTVRMDYAGNSRTMKITVPTKGSTMDKNAGMRAVKTLPNNRIEGVRKLRKDVRPMTRNAFNAPSNDSETVFFESFEGSDGTDLSWMPEGWTRESYGGEGLDPTQTWSVGMLNPSLPVPGPADGDFYMGVSFSSDIPQDEWMISPVIESKEGNELSFYWWGQPAFLFKMNNVDWETMEFIGDKEMAANLEVYVRAINDEDNSEWIRLFDLASKYMDLSLMELLEATPATMEKENLPLDGFAGGRLQVAFRYVGQDGDTMFVDAVKVAAPQLNALYDLPFTTQFFGLSDSETWSYAGFSSAIYPVFSPIYWMNMSENEVETTNSWTYLDPDTSEEVTSEETDLEVTYHPDYTSDFTTRNNLFYMPTLTVSAPGFSDGVYKAPYNYFQAGGAGDFVFNDGSEIHMGLLPFAIQNDNIGGVRIDYEAAGDMAMPLFGHNANTQAWWTDHYFNGEPSGDDYAKVTGLMNFLYATDSPMVVDGAWFNARGEINDDAEFTLGIYTVNDEFIPSEQPMVSAVCKGTDMKVFEGHYVIPFKFDAPVVLDNSNPAYVVKFSGFDSDACPDFLPMQSIIPNPNYCLGFLDLEVSSSELGQGHTFVPLANFEGEYGEMMNAFCINLDGFYPWLKANEEKVEITATGSVDITLDSYYDASVLNFDCPTGSYVSKAEGRYNKTVITLTHNMAEVIVDGDLVITAPGVEARIAVKETLAGVESIESDGDEVKAVYTLSGVEVDRRTLEPGIYLVSYESGVVRKVNVR